MAITRHDTDQQCSHIDRTTGARCITILCQYNEETECYAHSPQARIAERKQRDQLQMRRAARALDQRDLTDLMSQTDQRIAA